VNIEVKLVLKIIPLFSNLSIAQLESVGAHAQLMAFEKGSVILKEGDIADSFYVIVAGQVKVYIIDEFDPTREVILKTLGPGDFFGELPLLDQAPRSANVAALDRCHMQVLTYKAFQKAIENSPDIAARVMQTLATRLRHADRRINSLALTDISTRISRTLLELAIVSNGHRVVGEPFTQKDLASMVGASREMVNRTLQDLQDGGYITVQRKSITILDDRLATQA
jgi:CRP/FNR family transcriptional regulator, cyclic AMP receptor protein